MLPCNYSTQLQLDSEMMVRTGTVSDGTAGLSGMHLLSHGVHAFKVVAMLPQGLVHLVSDAHCSLQSDCGEIVTTFENNFVRDQNAVYISCRNGTSVNGVVVRVPAGTVRKAYRGCEWIWTNNTGYLLPPEQAVLVTNGLEPNAPTSIPESDILLQSDAEQVPSVKNRVPLFSLAASHTDDGASSCVVTPGVDLSDMPAIAAARNNITVAQNSAGLQAIWDGEQGRLLAGENVITG
jgi:hypothetical protein